MNPSTFQSDNARFQAERGYGEYVRASELNDSHIGRGIYCEVWRDHKWLYIDRIVPGDDGTVAIVYLEMKTGDPVASSDGDTRSEVTEHRVVRQSAEFAGRDQVLISAEAQTRPQGKRITVTTTRTEELLDD